MGIVFVDPKEINRENARFIDARFNLKDSTWGETVYKEGHIKDALFWDLEKDLSDMSKKEGRHPMPSKNQLKKLFEKSGLSYDDNIYIYDQGAAPFSARAWYLLTYAGLPNVYIVNGGMEQLVKEGFQLTKEVPSFPPTKLIIQWNDSIYADRDDVKQIVDGKADAVLLDARSNERFRGEHEPIDKKAGHIPAAKNFDWEKFICGNTLEWNEEIKKKVHKDEQIVVYCGSGVTAAVLFAMLKQEGYLNLRLYAGSFSDWIEHFDIETGDE